MKEFALQLQNIIAGYSNNKPVLENLSINIKKGEFLAILGPSGSGKTTILNVIAGFLQPFSGDIIIDGINVVNLPPHKRNVGMVFQSYALFPNMNVLQNVCFGLNYKYKNKNKKENEKKAFEMLDSLGITHLIRRKPDHISGGEKQRVALARSLVTDPKILLLDEPFSNLDAKLREKAREQVLQIKQSAEITIILVTHDQEEAMLLSDYIAILRNGQIEQIGSPHELYTQPRSRYVANFLGKANFFDAIVENVNGKFTTLDAFSGFKLNCIFQDEIPLKKGQIVEAMIRPDEIMLTDSSDNSIEAIVERVGFLGETLEVKLLVDKHLLIARWSPNYARAVKNGDYLRIRMQPEQIKLFPTNKGELLCDIN